MEEYGIGIVLVPKTYCSRARPEQFAAGRRGLVRTVSQYVATSKYVRMYLVKVDVCT